MASMKRIQKELNDFQKGDSEFVVTPDPSNSYLWTVTMQGPAGTPYEGGTFVLSCTFPKDYPFKAPKIEFVTKIYHCNVNDKGGICVDILKDTSGWTPALTVLKALQAISALLVEPNADDPLDAKIAQEYKTNRTLHDKNAKEWTKKYA